MKDNYILALTIYEMLHYFTIKFQAGEISICFKKFYGNAFDTTEPIFGGLFTKKNLLLETFTFFPSLPANKLHFTLQLPVSSLFLNTVFLYDNFCEKIHVEVM